MKLDWHEMGNQFVALTCAGPVTLCWRGAPPTATVVLREGAEDEEVLGQDPRAVTLDLTWAKEVVRKRLEV